MMKSSSIFHPAVFIPTLKRIVVQRTPPFMHPHLREVKYFVKFCVVGATGAFVDFGSLTVLYKVAHLPLALAIAIAFGAAVANNYTWNILWTYNHQDHSDQHHITLSKFLLVSLVGLAINETIVNLMTHVLNESYWLIAKLIATVIVLFWNFVANRIWTFRD
jgi:putative flippase GtrA